MASLLRFIEEKLESRQDILRRLDEMFERESGDIHCFEMVVLNLLSFIRPDDEEGLLADDGIDVPSDAVYEITMRVPGGGDWSNIDLHVAEHPIQVKVTASSHINYSSGSRRFYD